MIKEHIKYTDLDGNPKEKDFYFHFSEAELAEMEHSIDGGLTNYMHQIINADNKPKLIKLFKELILKAYGEKSLDGERFIKSEELSTAFSQTEAYSVMFMRMAEDDVYASNFFNGLIPKNVQERLNNNEKNSKETIERKLESVN